MSEFFFDPVVALRFEFEGEGLVAALHDATVPHDVNEIGHDVIQQTLIVSDHDDPQFRAAQGVHAFGNDPERVDVEAGIGFVHQGERRFEHRHLQNLAALFFAA